VTEGDALRQQAQPETLPPAGEETLRRLKRAASWLILAGVVAAFVAAGWRAALGVALGGALSLLNARWLGASVGAILHVAGSTGDPAVPRWAVSKFFLRYALVGFVMLAAAASGWFDLLGIGLGFAAFVGAAMLEAARQAYLTFRGGD
jgi:hypothetical protein